MSKARTVSDLMQADPRTLARNDTLNVADELMQEGHLRHLPVLDEDAKLCGVVSQRDIFRSALLHALGYGEWAETKVMRTVLVKEVMRESPITVAPGASVAEAAGLMLLNEVGCLPVIEADRLIGIITKSDLLRTLT